MSSTTNLSTFKPTYLYIKQHALTGKLYFGKTSKDLNHLLNVYKGGGNYWNDHLKVHGKEHVVTLWYELFTNQEELTIFALKFSKEMDIVESDSWANEIPENGLDGGISGRILSEETKAKMSIAFKGRKHSEETKSKISNAHKGMKWSELTKMKRKDYKHSDETRAKMSNNLKGHKQSIETIMKRKESNAGFKHSDETRAKMSIAQKGLKRSDETRAKISAARKRIHALKQKI
jgi:hypothetical protein